jgi:hypothetical protein
VKKKKKKKEEVHNIEIDEEDNASEEKGYGLPGGGDKVNGQGGGDEGEKKGERKATPPKYPLTETKTPRKRKVYPQKPSERKKTHASKP